MLDSEGLHIRAAFFAAVRDFFWGQGFLEVDTPILYPALIPEANIVPITAGRNFLQTSPEQCMKRLLASGCAKIFQICPCFRREERGTLHLEEFKMLEWYRLEADYRDLMADCRDLLDFLVARILPLLPENDFAAINGEWQHFTVQEAFGRYCPNSLADVLKAERFDENLVEYVEPQLGRTGPVILYDYPVEFASLAKKKNTNQKVAERFELYINGIEIANGFSELTDPDEQRARFFDEFEHIKGQGRHAGCMPEKFINDLAGLDRAAGIALGLDRLLMLFMGKNHINDVQSFSPADL